MKNATMFSALALFLAVGCSSATAPKQASAPPSFADAAQASSEDASPSPDGVEMTFTDRDDDEGAAEQAVPETSLRPERTSAGKRLKTTPDRAN